MIRRIVWTALAVTAAFGTAFVLGQDHGITLGVEEIAKYGVMMEPCSAPFERSASL